MPPQQPTPPSFIPKKPLDTSAYHDSGGFGFLFFIALFIFIASAVAAGGVFAYKSFLTSSIESKQESLRQNQEAFDPEQIDQLVRLDARLNSAKTLLSKHIAPSSIFVFLSQQTLQNIQFTSFNYVVNADGSGTIILNGLADSFPTVALQSDQFSAASSVLKDVIFSEVRTTGRTVTFSVKATVDPSFINYAKNLGTSGVQPIVPTETIPATSTPVTP